MTEAAAGFDFDLFNAECKKQYGDGAIQTVGGRPSLGAPGTFIPTSSEALNRAIGIGGIPVGRVIEIFGPEAGGKTSLALDICYHAQQMFPDRPVFYQDAEQAMNLDYAKAIGVDLSPRRFIFSQENECEAALDITHKAAKAGASVCVVDSVPTLSLKSDMEDDETTTERVGGIAKPLRSHLKKMVATCRKTGTTPLYLNHITYKVGFVLGNPETTPGGTGLKFYASLRLDVRAGKREVDKTTGEAFSARTKVKCVKNKVSSPYRTAEYDLVYGKGIDTFSDLAQVAIDTKVVTPAKGSWVTYGEQKFNGMGQLTEALRGDKKFAEKIRKAVYAAE